MEQSLTMPTTPQAQDYGEPWSLFEEGADFFPGIQATTAPERHSSVVVWGDEEDDCGVRGPTHEAAKERAKRIVECVNACASIIDPHQAIAAAREALKQIYDDTEGCADGAPDASAHDKVCNHVSSIAKRALQLLQPND